MSELRDKKITITFLNIYSVASIILKKFYTLYLYIITDLYINVFLGKKIILIICNNNNNESNISLIISLIFHRKTEYKLFPYSLTVSPQNVW